MPATPTDEEQLLNRIGSISHALLLISAGKNPGEFLAALASVAAHTIVTYYDQENYQAALDRHTSAITAGVTKYVETTKDGQRAP